MNQTSPFVERRAPPPIAVLGPTNTGKTHYAIERMLAYGSGMIGLPLRLLAREVFDRIVERKGARSVALVTGEEKIVPPSPRYWVCTVEAMPLDREVDFLAIDEIQLAADLERGRVFTSRLLHARGLAETLFLGSETMRPILRRMFAGVSFLSRERFSVLSYTGQKKVTRLPRRSAVVGFSADTVYAVAELVRRQRGGAAVILGALSPRTRNAQAALYQSGEVDYLVATDAIGMGLNMDIDHVAFAAQKKFDGRSRRALRNDELAQIAGRAGRYMRDGTFGVTGECPPFDEDVVEAIEEHAFEPVAALQWRNEDLDFSSIPALARSLGEPPPRVDLRRARLGDDEEAFLRLAASDDIRTFASGREALSLLWSVCETPDFRKVAGDTHARLLADIYLQLAGKGRIAGDWIAPRVELLNRVDGDLDTISARISHIRTWTYLSHRPNWLEDGAYWQERTRAIEDSLSDALHEKLTQRFVDRRTSVLLKKLKDDEPLLAGVTEDGEVIVEGQFVGRLLGFEFIVDPRASGPDAKRMRAAADRSLGPVLASRAAALANAAADELSLREDGVIAWRSSAVASLKKGPAPLRPNIAMRGVDTLSPHLRARIEERLQGFFAAKVEGLLGELVTLQVASSSTDAGGLAPMARGVAYRLVENFGAISRTQFGEELKQLDQEERSKLRKLGVRFGEFTLFMPALLKPAPARLLTLLWSLWADREPAKFQPPKAGLVSLPADKDLPHAYYYASGYRPSGARAVRIDMLERLAGQIRADRREGEYRGGFEASSQMMSLVGCSGEEFEGILVSLGYRKQTVKVRRPAAAAAAPVADARVEETAEAGAVPPDTSELQPTAEPDAVANVAEVVDAAPVAEPTGVTAPAPAGENAEPVTAVAELTQEVEVVVWRQAPRRPAGGAQRRLQRGQEQGQRETQEKRARERRPTDGAAPRGVQAADANRGRDRRPESGRPPRDGGDQRRQGGGKGGFAERDRHAPRMPQNAPQHRKVADPNSPFAVLAGLKEELTRQAGPTGKPDKA